MKPSKYSKLCIWQYGCGDYTKPHNAETIQSKTLQLLWAQLTRTYELYQRFSTCFSLPSAGSAGNESESYASSEHVLEGGGRLRAPYIILYQIGYS